MKETQPHHRTINQGKNVRKHKQSAHRFKKTPSKDKPAGAKSEKGKTKKQHKPKDQQSLS